MVSPYLQIADIPANSNNQSTQANNQTASLDGAINAPVTKAITGDTSFTTAETRENGHIELTGTPGAPHTIDMPDTFARTLMVTNSTDDQMTIQNSVGGGTGQPVLAVNDTVLFNYDGTNFKSVSGGGGGGGSFLSLTDTPSSYSGQVGKIPQVNPAGDGLEFGNKISGGVAGAWHVLQIEAGAQTDYDFSFQSGFSKYMIVGWAVPSDDAVDAQLQVSDDDFATVESGASDYAWTTNGQSTSGAVNTSDTADTRIRLANVVGSAAGEFIKTTVEINEPNNASLQTFFSAKSTYISSTPNTAGYEVGGRYVTASALTGVRFGFSAGTVEDGSMILLGLAEEITVPANGAMKAIQHENSASAVNEVDLVLPATGYRDFEISGWVRPTTDDDEMEVLVSIDGGSTFVTAASSYRYSEHRVDDGGTASPTGSTGDTKIQLVTNVGNAATEHLAFRLRINDPLSTSVYTSMNLVGEKMDGTGSLSSVQSAGVYQQTTAVDAIRIKFSGANTIAAHDLTLYGFLTEPDADITPELILTHEETANTAGGGSTASTYVKRNVSTTKKNTITGASVASDVVTLPAGTYEFNSWTHSFQNGHTKDRLRDTTAGATLIVGGSGRNPTTTNDVSHPTLTNGQFTISVTTDIELQTNSELTKATDGFGTPANLGEVEVYVYAKFRKIG